MLACRCTKTMDLETALRVVVSHRFPMEAVQADLHLLLLRQQLGSRHGPMQLVRPKRLIEEVESELLLRQEVEWPVAEAY